MKSGNLSHQGNLNKCSQPNEYQLIISLLLDLNFAALWIVLGALKRNVLKNFVKLTGKHFCHNLYFKKVAGCRTSLLLKRNSNRGVFLWNFQKFEILVYPARALRPLRLLSPDTHIHFFWGALLGSFYSWDLLKSDKACLQNLNSSSLFYKHSFQFS